MKSLKFMPYLIEQILSGAKTATWRLFDDKALSRGDKLEFINQESGEKFADAEISNIKEKELGLIVDEDFIGHGKF